MCDYTTKNRPAKVTDRLVTHNFGYTRGPLILAATKQCSSLRNVVQPRASAITTTLPRLVRTRRAGRQAPGDSR